MKYTFNSVTQSCSTLCDPMDCSMPDLPVHHQLPEFAQTHVHRVGNAIQPPHPLLSPPPPALNLCQHRVFSKKSFLCIRWPQHWSFSFSISPSNEYSGLISFRIDCFDLLAVQGMITVSLIREGKLSAEQKVREVPFLWDRGPGESEMLGAA